MSVKPESVENLGEASLQPGLSVNEGEWEFVEVGNSRQPPSRRGSSYEPERELNPNNDDPAEKDVFGIPELREKILELAILDGSVGESSPSRDLALPYRLVCRDWRDTINSIYWTAGLPLFEYRDWYPTNLMRVKRAKLKSLTSLFAPPVEPSASSSLVPPVSLGFSLSCDPSTPLETKLELKATALNTLHHMGSMLLMLKLELPHNSLEGMNCSSLDLKSLKHLELNFYDPNDCTPDTLGPWKTVEDIVKAAPSLKTLIIKNRFLGAFAETPELVLPTTMEKLELQCIKIPMWLIEVAPTLKNMRQLVLKMGEERLSGPEPAGHMENLLVNKWSKHLEHLEECWESEAGALVPTLSILESMPKLRSLKLHFWKLGELSNYKELLPSLTDLEVWAYSNVHVPASWYTSSCSTLRRLFLNIDYGPSDASPLSQQVLRGISMSFPNLHELEVEGDQCADDNWQAILCQGFPNLRILRVRCGGVSAEGRNRLVAAVSGIPLKKLKAIWKGKKELEQVMNQHRPSLRNLQFLEFLMLNVLSMDEVGEDPQFWSDSSVMIYSTFLQMPNLKRVVLSSRFQLPDELEQYAWERGLDICTY